MSDTNDPSFMYFFSRFSWWYLSVKVSLCEPLWTWFDVLVALELLAFGERFPLDFLEA